MVLGCHEEIARLGRVVGCLFRYVVAFGTIRVVPVTSEYFAQDRIEWLLNAPTIKSVLLLMGTKFAVCLRRFDVPAAEVELCHGYESLDGVLNCGYGEQAFRMCHETVSTVSDLVTWEPWRVCKQTL